MKGEGKGDAMDTNTEEGQESAPEHQFIHEHCDESKGLSKG